MPILNDIMDHQVIGPAIRSGIEQGRQEGAEIGRREEALHLLRRLVEKRFGVCPEWAIDHLEQRSLEEVEKLSVRLQDAGSLSELFS